MKSTRIEEFRTNRSSAEFFESFDVFEGGIAIEANDEPGIVLASAASLRQRRVANQRIVEIIEVFRQKHQSLDSDDLVTELEESDLSRA